MEGSDIEEDCVESRWQEDIHTTRIDTSWLDYNPHMFLPLNFDAFLKTGSISRIKTDANSPNSTWKPHFIVGCGRSGTTLICKLLSAHPEVCFLNEPRELWMQEFPEFDIWSVAARQRGGQLKLSSDLLTDEKKAAVRNLFYTVMTSVTRSQLVEKTPENVFRLEWLQAIFPKCKILVVKRDALATARSISRFQPKMWYGFSDNYKWNQLLELLPSFREELSLSQDFLDFANSHDSNFSKALLEWTLSMLSARKFANSLSIEERKKRYLEVKLENLLSRPNRYISKILKFLELAPSPDVYNLAEEIIQTNQSSAAAVDDRIEGLHSGYTEHKILSMAGPSLVRLIEELSSEL